MPLPNSYKVNLTDPNRLSKSGSRGFFYIEPETTNGTLSVISEVLEVSSFLANTSLKLDGYKQANYGERYVAESFLHILESFSSPISPVNPINGQVWYDTGKSYVILDGVIGGSPTEQITVEGDVVSKINDVIAETEYTVSSPIVQNPKGNLRIIGSVNLTFRFARPVSATLNLDGNTEIDLASGTLTGIPEFQTELFYATIPTDRNVLKLYNEDDSGWEANNKIYMSTNEPEEIEIGEMWIDDSNPSVPLLKFFANDVYHEVLTFAGGTLVGPLYHSGIITSPLDINELVPKFWVDDEILADIIGGDFGDVSLYQGQIATLKEEVGVLQVTVVDLVDQYDTIEAEYISTIGTFDPLPEAGGTMDGNITFWLHPAGSGISRGIAFEGTAAPTLNHGLDIFSKYDSDVMHHRLVINTPAGTNYGAIDFDTDSDRQLEITPNHILVNKMYELAASTTVGSVLDTDFKYLTQTELDTNITSFATNNLIIDIVWESTTYNLHTSNTVSGTDTDLSHDHDPAVYDMTKKDPTYEKIKDVYSDDTDNIILAVDAIRALDIITPASVDATLTEGASNFTSINAISTSLAPNEIVISIGEGELINEISTASSIPTQFFGYKKASAAIGQIGIDTANGDDSTGLQEGLPYAMTIIFDEHKTINVNFIGPAPAGSPPTLVTFEQLAAIINNKIQGFGTATLTEDGDNRIIIQSNTIGALSKVEFEDINLFSSIQILSGVNIGPYLGVNVGVGAEIEYGAPLVIDTIINNVTDYTIEFSVLPSLEGFPPPIIPLTAEDIETILIPSTAINSSHLTTKYQVDGLFEDLLNSRIEILDSINKLEYAMSTRFRFQQNVGGNSQDIERGIVIYDGPQAEPTARSWIGIADEQVTASHDGFFSDVTVTTGLSGGGGPGDDLRDLTITTTLDTSGPTDRYGRMIVGHENNNGRFNYSNTNTFSPGNDVTIVNEQLYSIAAGNGLVVVVGNNGTIFTASEAAVIATPTASGIWTDNSIVTTGNFRGVVYHPTLNRFYAIMLTGEIYESLDGSVFSQIVDLAETVFGHSFKCEFLPYVDRYVIVLSTSTTRYYSDNGINYNAVDGAPLQNIQYVENQYAGINAVAGAPQFFTSIDGRYWKPRRHLNGGSTSTVFGGFGAVVHFGAGGGLNDHAHVVFTDDFVD